MGNQIHYFIGFGDHKGKLNTSCKKIKNFSYNLPMKLSYVEFLQDVLITIHMNIREIQERKSFAEPEELTHIEAKLLAYHEVLTILRDSADQFDIPKKEIGL